MFYLVIRSDDSDDQYMANEYRNDRVVHLHNNIYLKQLVVVAVVAM